MPAWRPSTGHIRLLCFALCAIPLGQAAWWIASAQLGVNPIETLTHHSGQWALRLLLVTLAMSPLQRLARWRWPLQIRRQLGLWSFFYLLCHFAVYLVFDLSLSLARLGEEILERPYITVGFAALLLLTPLAVTSTRGWQRRLRRNWKRLHRLVYPAAVLACVHFIWKVKVSEPEPFIYLTVLLVLFAVRLRRA
ncbi:MAG: sulfoxide reductase heme-binding subunit YedZ [Oceanococcus sp.]|nr:MAG: sulfoxide reductase heme-binding subunit YedZ [Oceanococcus sp.]